VNDLQDCQQCPRLTAYRIEQKQKFPEYRCLPVPAFGEPAAQLLIVGLAPGLHGANATGRPFTGDASGDLLFATLHKCGFATRPVSHSCDDEMQLIDCRITNAVKCAPPGNRPSGIEIDRCSGYLRSEILALAPGSVLLALGTIAHRASLKALNLTQARYRFSQHAEHDLADGLKLIDSIHPSRYNQNTRRITAQMFEATFNRIRLILQ